MIPCSPNSFPRSVMNKRLAKIIWNINSIHNCLKGYSSVFVKTIKLYQGFTGTSSLEALPVFNWNPWLCSMFFHQIQLLIRCLCWDLTMQKLLLVDHVFVIYRRVEQIKVESFFFCPKSGFAREPISVRQPVLALIVFSYFC